MSGFWKRLQQLLPVEWFAHIVLVDDFGANELKGDRYDDQAKVTGRLEKTIEPLAAVFQAQVDVFPFYLDRTAANKEAAFNALIAEAEAFIEKAL